MIERLEREIEERSAYIEGVIGNAQDQDRDLPHRERELPRPPASGSRPATTQLERPVRVAVADHRRPGSAPTEVHREFDRLRNQVDNGPVEYRSTGAYLVDYIAGSNGSRDAMERLELYTRAAAHQKTTDNLGCRARPDHRQRHQLHRRQPAAGELPRPAEPALGDLVPAEGDPADHRRRAGFGRCGRG